MKIYVTHVYDNGARLRDYYVHDSVEGAVREAAADVVHGRFPRLEGDDYRKEITRVISTVTIEPGVERRLVHCDMWFAHVDVMLLRT